MTQKIHMRLAEINVFRTDKITGNSKKEWNGTINCHSKQCYYEILNLMKLLRSYKQRVIPDDHNNCQATQ